MERISKMNPQQIVDVIPPYNPDNFKKDGRAALISPKALNIIIWGKSKMFLKWIKPSTGESSFNPVPEVIQVKGLYVYGELDLSKFESDKKFKFDNQTSYDYVDKDYYKYYLL